MIERHPSMDPAHPGEILREDILPALSMSKTAVAAALGISRQTLYDILNEKQPVTAEMAVRFGKLFGNGAGFLGEPATHIRLGARGAHGGRLEDSDDRGAHGIDDYVLESDIALRLMEPPVDPYHLYIRSASYASTSAKRVVPRSSRPRRGTPPL